MREKNKFREMQRVGKKSNINSSPILWGDLENVQSIAYKGLLYAVFHYFLIIIWIF